MACAELSDITELKIKNEIFDDDDRNKYDITFRFSLPNHCTSIEYKQEFKNTAGATYRTKQNMI